MTFSESTSPRVKDTRWRIFAKQVFQARINKSVSTDAPIPQDTRWSLRRKLNRILAP